MFLHRSLWQVGIVLVTMLVACSLPGRIFEMKDGTKVDGEIVSFKNGTIVIAKTGGGKGLYTLSAFSAADQQYLNETFPSGSQRKEVKGTTTRPKPTPAPQAKSKQSATPQAKQQARPAQQAPHPGLKNLRVGSIPPEIAARIQGKQDKRGLGDLRGKLVVIHFWSTSAPQSVREVEGLAYLYRKYQKHGFELLGVAVDQSQRRLNSVEESMGVTWPMILDEERRTIEKWGVTALPTNVLIDQNGVIVNPHISANQLQYVLAEQFGVEK
ncbi:MAG: TlpA disulfide reductase family protein [Verrucomicrobiota bacterium]